MESVKVVFVMTSHGHIDDSEALTGVWLEELTTPYYLFKDAGCEVVIASIAGGLVPVEPRSLDDLEDKPQSVLRFMDDDELQAAMNDSVAVDSICGDEFDVVFLPGGHGTMWDFPENVALAKLVGATLQSGHVVAAVCHGVAGLLRVVDDNGAPLVRHKRLTSFTDSEEAAVGLAQAVPFLLESRLRALGADFRKAGDFEAHVTVDHHLITGQNPASSRQVALSVLGVVKG